MRGLTAEDVLGVWERSQGHSPTVAALLSLASALPDEPWDALVGLPLGARDTLLLRLRSATLGDALECRVECPSCGQALEFTLRSEALVPPDATSAPEASNPGETPFERDALEVVVRPLDSTDLLAAETFADPRQRAEGLARRTLVSAVREGESLTFDALDTAERQWLGELLLEVDPRAETLLRLRCPDCDHAWGSPFDIAGYFAAELAFEAEKLLAQVHALARFYGWRERDILAMSAVRRRAYLEQAGQ